MWSTGASCVTEPGVVPDEGDDVVFAAQDAFELDGTEVLGAGAVGAGGGVAGEDGEGGGAPSPPPPQPARGMSTEAERMPASTRVRLGRAGGRLKLLTLMLPLGLMVRNRYPTVKAVEIRWHRQAGSVLVFVRSPTRGMDLSHVPVEFGAALRGP
jgi:hypothetical protein